MVYEFKTKDMTLFVALMFMGFTIVSYSLDMLKDPVYWVIALIMLICIFTTAGLSYRVYKKTIVITRFGKFRRRMNFTEFRFAKLGSYTLSILSYGRIPMIFFGIKPNEYNNILSIVNEQVLKASREQLDNFDNNRKNLLRTIKYFVLALIFLFLFCSLDSTEVKLGKYFLLAICFLFIALLLSSVAKMRKT